MDLDGKASPELEDYVESFLKRCPPDPLAPNYHNARKIKAAQCIERCADAEAAFHLSEATAAGLRTMALYRHEQVAMAAGDKTNIVNYLKEHIMDKHPPLGAEDRKLYPFLENGIKDLQSKLKDVPSVEKEPFHRRYLRFTEENNVENFLKILKEFPEEWTIVQLSVPYNPNESIKPRTVHRAEIDSIYVSLLRNDYADMAVGPVNVQLPANITKEGELPLFVELYSLLDANLQTMENAGRVYTQRNVHQYWQKRQDIDLRMASVIKVMDTEWLGGWKSLLTGKLTDKDMRDRIRRLIDITCEDWGFVRFTPTQRVLLCNLLESSHHIPSAEIRSTLQKILTKFPNLEETKNIVRKSNFKGCQKCSKNFKMAAELCLKCLAGVFEAVHHFTLVDGIKAFMDVAKRIKNEEEWEALRSVKRHPVILIVDEMLDTFPWESLPILSGQPVTRVENVHLLYSMYKTHESDIVDGHFVVKRNPLLGRYVINPANNLERMGKRMCRFVSYWCPEWDGDSDRPPQPTDLLRYLTTGDLLLYCGHGDGCQYAAGAEGGCGVEAAAAEGGIRATALLSGCGSVRLQYGGDRAPPLASHYHYHIAGSPLVVGMLWEVTDLEVDKVVTTLLALAVPSKAPVPWECVGKAQWSQGQLDLNVESKASKLGREQDILCAIAKARRASSFLVIASAMVARGLPVRFTAQDDK